MHRRKLEELNLIDDFLFYAMVSYPEIGELFSRALVEMILGRRFGKLKVVPQKVYYGKDTDKHGGRLDVYLEEEVDMEDLLADATVFDLEAEQNSKTKNIIGLPRRARFYHSLMDTEILKSGADYASLKRAIVLMIMPFDPFGYDHMIYTIKNTCQEVPELEYDDGAMTVFVYTKGKKGKITKELRELMRYLEDTREENAVNETLKIIHEMVEKVKKNLEVSKGYMKSFERDRMLIEEGREEERANTERERLRAQKETKRADDEAKRANNEEKRANEAEQTVAYLKRIMYEYGIVV